MLSQRSIDLYEAHPVLHKAIHLYEEFHKYPPKKIGKFPPSFKIPTKIGHVGEALEVLYRSKKNDPVTYKPVPRARDYIHEHEGKVKCFRTDATDARSAKTPQFILKTKALVFLGQCLGFAYEDRNDGQEIEARMIRPYPELYTILSGKALLVVQDKRKVLALMYGGRLGVEDRGIVY